MKLLLAALLLLGCRGIDPSLLESCDDHCEVMPSAVISDTIRKYLRETSPGFVCAPDRDIAHGSYYPVPCISVLGLEGRCLGICIPEVKKSAIFLSRGICWAGEVCAPCRNPFSNAWTDACFIGDDHPESK